MIKNLSSAEYRILRDLNPESAHLFQYGHLGEIEFLADHPRILALLVKRSEAKSLEPFIADKYVAGVEGGFTWGDSFEGHDFWQMVLGEQSPSYFYEQYGPDEAPTE